MMLAWPRNPVIYEINTWVWLRELSRKYGRAVDLGSVPPDEWDQLSSLHCDAVWLMGVWQRSAAAIRQIAADENRLNRLRQALEGFTPEDLVAPPFSIRRYRADPLLGGPEGLAAAREQLALRGIRLVLDFVPNHVAPDHLWVTEHPEFFLQGRDEDRHANPGAFLNLENGTFACGRDPNYPPWQETLQLNLFHPELRAATGELLLEIAGQCDGLRCDMAMLAINEVFEENWGHLAGRPPEEEYWPGLLSAVQSQIPGFLFIAEAYWSREVELQQQGFHYCYDKILYDVLRTGDVEAVRTHLQTIYAHQQKLIRFVENHGEERAAAVFPGARNQAATLVAALTPGAKLIHQGQREGRLRKHPLLLGRWAEEGTDEELKAFHERLSAAFQAEEIHSGNWRLCELQEGTEQPGSRNILAWCWWWEDHRFLVLVNFSGLPSRGQVLLPWTDLEDRVWNLFDMFSNRLYTRTGAEMSQSGLSLDLAPWEFHLFRFYNLSPW